LCIEGTPHFCGSTYEALERALKDALRENQRLTRKVARLEKRERTNRKGDSC
jgi:phosphoglycerate dehydrogenase-like enzyme